MMASSRICIHHLLPSIATKRRIFFELPDGPLDMVPKICFLRQWIETLGDYRVGVTIAVYRKYKVRHLVQRDS